MKSTLILVERITTINNLMTITQGKCKGSIRSLKRSQIDPLIAFFSTKLFFVFIDLSQK